MRCGQWWMNIIHHEWKVDIHGWISSMIDKLRWMKSPINIIECKSPNTCLMIYIGVGYEMPGLWKHLASWFHGVLEF